MSGNLIFKSRLSSPPCPLNFPSHFPCHCLFSPNLRDLALVAFLSQNGSLLQQHKHGLRFCRKVPPSSPILQQVECIPSLPLLAFLISPNLSSTSSTSSSHLNPHHLDNVALGETTMTTQCAKISILSIPMISLPGFEDKVLKVLAKKCNVGCWNALQ